MRFKVEAIRLHGRGLTLELREAPEPGEEGHFHRCSPATTGPNFSLHFVPTDPLYERATKAGIGAELTLSFPDLTPQ